MANKEIIEKPYNDMSVSYNNGVYAVYIIGKDVLEAENKTELLGVPFLVWNGSWTPIGPSVERAREIVNVPYISKDQIKVLEDQLVTKSEQPEKVSINGVEYPIGKLRTGYVPYSFGFGHKSDVEEKLRVRTLSEYENLVNNVLPNVAEIRKQRGEVQAKDNSTLNKILSSVGLYKPTKFSRYEPTSNL